MPDENKTLSGSSVMLEDVRLLSIDVARPAYKDIEAEICNYNTLTIISRLRF